MIFIPIANPESLKYNLLQWAQGFEVNCLLDSNHYPQGFSGFDWVLAVGAKHHFNEKSGFSHFQELKKFLNQHLQWTFGFFSYDLKNELENLVSQNIDEVEMPLIHFFIPEILIFCQNNFLNIHCDTTWQKEIENIVKTADKKQFKSFSFSSSPLQFRYSKDEYLNTINSALHHILFGDVYEINICQEFFYRNVECDPVSLFRQMNKRNPSPFAAFYKLGFNYLICSSPERFLKKTGTKIISQPMKGTIKRSLIPSEDELLKKNLFESAKERSENVMIVDLVRNDLSKVAVRKSVRVEELYGIYSFTAVHQMISTISAELKPELHAVDAITAAFPMGSMTGAPKIRAMQIIEELERTRRGVFSGAVGFFSPENDFDFNVVIRSLLYNKPKAYLSMIAGGAITAQSKPENEYKESLLKARSILKTIDGIGVPDSKD